MENAASPRIHPMRTRVQIIGRRIERAVPGQNLAVNVEQQNIASREIPPMASARVLQELSPAITDSDTNGWRWPHGGSAALLRPTVNLVKSPTSRPWRQRPPYPLFLSADPERFALLHEGGDAFLVIARQIASLYKVDVRAGRQRRIAQPSHPFLRCP